MKLILCSEGFSTKEIVDKCLELVGKPKGSINVAIINEAYAVEQNNLWWVLKNLNRVKDSFGGNLELVNLLALDLSEIKKRMERSDIISVVGGHTDYLMSVFSINQDFLSFCQNCLNQKCTWVVVLDQWF